MRRLMMSRLIWIYAVCKSLLLSPVAMKEFRTIEHNKLNIRKPFGTLFYISRRTTNQTECNEESLWYMNRKSRKTYLTTCAPNEDSNQPAHPRSLIRVSVVRMKTPSILGYPKCAQSRFCSDCAIAQADLNLRYAHMSEVTFLTLRLIWRWIFYQKSKWCVTWFKSPYAICEQRRSRWACATMQSDQYNLCSSA